jgi:hypothetical protein
LRWELSRKMIGMRGMIKREADPKRRKSQLPNPKRARRMVASPLLLCNLLLLLLLLLQKTPQSNSSGQTDHPVSHSSPTLRALPSSALLKTSFPEGLQFARTKRSPRR